MRSLARKGMSARQAAPLIGRTVGALKYKAMTENVRFHFIEQPAGVQKKRFARRRRRAS